MGKIGKIFNTLALFIICLSRPINGEHRPLVTDSPAVEVQYFMKITHYIWEIYGIYLNFIKKNQKITTCNRLDLETLRSWPIMPKISLDTRPGSLNVWCRNTVSQMEDSPKWYSWPCKRGPKIDATPPKSKTRKRRKKDHQKYRSSLGRDKLTTGKSLKFLTVVRLTLPSRKIKRNLQTVGPKFNVFARVPKGWPLLALEMCKFGAESLRRAYYNVYLFLLLFLQNPMKAGGWEEDVS